jgi:tRNA nucleotidyltransferase (CCA-adding enzyme)
MARHHGAIHRCETLSAPALVRLFEATDALRRPERFRLLLDTCLCDYTGRLGWENRDYSSPARLLAALAIVNAVPAGQIAAGCADRGSIPERIHSARTAALQAWLDETGEQPEQ